MINMPETKLYIGSIDDIKRTDDEGWAFVHATQTIHYKIFNWNRKYNKPKKTHPNYIIHEKGSRLSLNWVDGGSHLYDWSGPETFIRVLDFIDKWVKEKKVLVHCDKGQSRAPTIGLLYLAKRLKRIPNESFSSARDEFAKIYPNYLPGGIGDYVKEKWKEIT